MAAEKYQLEQLKSICGICVERLCNNIEVGNCLDYLVVGDLYQADILKNAALQFIARNMGNVFKCKDWKNCLEDHPKLMAEVIDAIARPGGGDNEVMNESSSKIQEQQESTN